jgi:CheY-like chemotaxis protein
VIDDDEVARELLASVLEEAGYVVFQLPSPIGATSTIFREGIDVVVLDVLMPEMSGDKLARLLRSNSRLAQLTIVLVSGCQPTELSRLAQQVGADAVVSKSEVRTHLLDAVGRGKKQQRKQL